MVDEIIDAVLKAEGWPQFTDDPLDRGGPTKGGITLKTLSSWRGRPVSAQELMDLEEAEAREIYRHRYVEEPGFGKVRDARLQALLVDCAVLHGPVTAVRFLQQALPDVEVDGKLGPVTRTALDLASPHKVAILVCAERWVYTAGIIARDSSQARFARGWAIRMSQFLREEVTGRDRRLPAEGDGS